MFYTTPCTYRNICTIAFRPRVLHGGTMPQLPKVEIEIVIGKKLVRERRAQLAPQKKRIVIPELTEGKAGEIFLGEIQEGREPRR